MPKSCRFCQSPLQSIFVDLGLSPLSNSYLTANQLQNGEIFYPLLTYVCHECFLVQLLEYHKAQDIFHNYAYFSSYSTSWLEHCRQYSEQMIKTYQLNANHLVMEVASNDGYLLQYFLSSGLPVLGIEPAENVAEVARQKGIPTESIYLDTHQAQQILAKYGPADLLIGNNVLAHVPNLNNFVQALTLLLNERGTLTMEFPHLLQLMQENQFDTIYHEHFSYFSLKTVCRIFAQQHLNIFDTEELPTHGGSLRIHACKDLKRAKTSRMQNILAKEQAAGLEQLSTYQDFGVKVRQCKIALLNFLFECQQQGKTVAAYGAPAKGNTLLNYCGIRQDLVVFTVDRSPHKQGLFLPGSRIPIYAPNHIASQQPDFLLILPWNLKTEIMAQMEYIREWGGQFVLPIPHLMVC